MNSTDQTTAIDNNGQLTLNRQMIRADQCSVVNHNFTRQRVERANGIAAGKVALAGNLISRYKCAETNAQNGTLPLVSPLGMVNESGAEKIVTQLKENVIYRSPERKVSPVEAVNDDGKPVDLQRNVDKTNMVDSNVTFQKEHADFVLPVKRILARENNTGLINGALVQRKFDQTNQIGTSHTVSINRTLSRLSSSGESAIQTSAPVLQDKNDPSSMRYSQAEVHSQLENSMTQNDIGFAGLKTSSGGDNIISRAVNIKKPDSGKSPVINSGTADTVWNFGSHENIFRSVNKENASKHKKGLMPSVGNSDGRFLFEAIDKSSSSISTKINSYNETSTDLSLAAERLPEKNNESAPIALQKQSLINSNEIKTAKDIDTGLLFRSADASVNSKKNSAIVNAVSQEPSSSVVMKTAATESKLYNRNASFGNQFSGSTGRDCNEKMITPSESKYANTESVGASESKFSGSKDILVFRKTNDTSIYNSSAEAGTDLNSVASVNPCYESDSNSRTLQLRNINETGSESRPFVSEIPNPKTDQNAQVLLFRKSSESISFKKNQSASVPHSPEIKSSSVSTPVDLVWRKNQSSSDLQRECLQSKSVLPVSSPSIMRKSDDSAGIASTQSRQADISADNNQSISNSVIDIEQIADRIERLLSRRLLIERERRGTRL